MSGRIRHQFGVLLLVVVVALFALGCMGGEKTTTTTSIRDATTAPSGPGGSSGDAAGTPIRPTEDSPAEFKEACGVRPIVVLFYVPGSVDDISVSETLKGLASSFSNYLFLVYDYKTPDAYGDLSSLLQVGYPPALILIDRNGVVEKVWNGYVDEGTMKQALVNLERA